MVTFSNDFNTIVSENIPKTWDLFTLLDTGGQPEFINMLPAINTSMYSNHFCCFKLVSWKGVS